MEREEAMNKPLLRASMALMIIRAAARVTGEQPALLARQLEPREREALVPASRELVDLVVPRPPVRASRPDDDEPGDLVDYALLLDWARFVLHSVGRHHAFGGFVLALGVGAAIGAAVLLPRNYEAHTKLLTHETGFMSTLSNPQRDTPDEGPTRAARERVLARENLEKIVSETELVRVWQASRNPVMRAKDALLQLIADPWTAEDLTDMMVELLEKRMKVEIGDGTVDIGITWPDAVMARRIIEVAQQNYLETRHVAEVAAISETLGILELHTSEAQSAIDDALKDLQRVQNGLHHGRGSTRQPRRDSPETDVEDTAADGSARELAQLELLLRSKQRAVSDLEDFRARQLAEVRAQLAQQGTIYSKSHPVIVELEQRLEAVQKDSPQLARLRHEEDDLIKQIQAKGGGKKAPVRKASRAQARRAPAVPAPVAAELERNPVFSLAEDQLRMSLARHQELLMRVEAAQLELDTARAAFKYRFSVVKPAQTPRTPVSPNVALILLAGLLGAVLLAFLSCTALDLWRGVPCEPWQIERQLRLPVLLSVKR
jgi:uncharacterized protein involved in exopolysaccharide biosynthesis